GAARDEAGGTRRRAAPGAAPPAKPLGPPASWARSLASAGRETRRRSSQAHGHHAQSRSEGSSHAPAARLVAVCGLARLLVARGTGYRRCREMVTDPQFWSVPGPVIAREKVTGSPCDDRRSSV